MPITSITDTIDGQSISWSGQSGRVYSNSLIVVTNDPTIGPRSLLKSLGFKNGDHYRFPLATLPNEWDYGSFVQSMTAKKSADDGCQWLVELQYGPFDWTGQGGATSDAAGEGRFDPFAIPPKVTFGSTKFERSCVRDALNKAIVNTAGDPFDPPLKRDDSRPTLTIVRNEAAFDSQYVQQFKDTTNQGVFLTKYQPNTVKCGDVTAEREYHADYGYYWVVTYFFEIREYVVDANNNVIVAGWTEEVLSSGLRQLKTPFNVSAGQIQITIQGVPVTSPVLLNQNGVYDPAAQPYYLGYQLYPTQDFDKFKFADDLLTVGSIVGQAGS